MRSAGDFRGSEVAGDAAHRLSRPGRGGVASPAPTARRSRRPISAASWPGGRPPAGRSHVRSASSDDVPGRQVARAPRSSAAPQPRCRFRRHASRLTPSPSIASASRTRSTSVCELGRDRPRACGRGTRNGRGRGEVLLDDARAERDREQRRLDAERVVGIADRDAERRRAQGWRAGWPPPPASDRRTTQCRSTRPGIDAALAPDLLGSASMARADAGEVGHAGREQDGLAGRRHALRAAGRSRCRRTRS